MTEQAVHSERRRTGLRFGMVLLVVVAYPVLSMASLSHAGFSGCWLTCGGTPQPASGTVWAIAGAALLAFPIGVGLRVAGVRSPWAWAAGLLGVVTVAVGWVLWALDPANADFFVTLGE